MEKKVLSETRKVTFQLEELERGTEPLTRYDFEKALHLKFGENLEGFPTSERELTVINHDTHSVLFALTEAFNHHKPIVLSPDIIWLLIAQGFTQHMSIYSEALRDKFVQHEGKVALEVQANHFLKGQHNDWASVFPQFSSQIRGFLGDQVVDCLTPSFSTTGPIEKAVFELTLMNAFADYFEFGMISWCGIPEVTLLGEVEDWKQLKEHMQKLKEYELAWWVDALLPILDEFVRASEGNANVAFWKSMYKYDSMSGGPFVTGWVLKFFPYLEDLFLVEEMGRPQTADLVKKVLVDDETIRGFYRNPALLKEVGSHELSLSDFPDGLNHTDFKWQYYGEEFSMALISGFVGVYEDPETFALEPAIAWAVREKK